MFIKERAYVMELSHGSGFFLLNVAMKSNANGRILVECISMSAFLYTTFKKKVVPSCDTTHQLVYI